MTLKKTLLNKLIIPVPRQWLFFTIAAIWMFASFRIFMTAWEGILQSNTSVFLFIVISFLGSIIFTRMVFSKVTLRYITRIRNLESSRPSLFNMMSVKSYLLLAFMIAMGIAFSKLNILPENIFSMFLGSLGLSLFTSSLQFLRAWRMKPAITLE